jgi:hypothetical protein
VNLLEIALPEIVSTGQQRDGLAGPETLIEVAKNSEVERIVKKLIVIDLDGTLNESKSSLDPQNVESESCGDSRCHTTIYEEWLPSAHHFSGADPAR